MSARLDFGQSARATRVLEVAVPAGARFKGYQDFVVQELSIARRVMRLRRWRWQLADGTLVVAPLPARLRDLGIDISKRQRVRLPTAGKQDVATDPVLEAGLNPATGSAPITPQRAYVSGLPGISARPLPP